MEKISYKTGFTLIELLIVISIITIMAFIGVSSFSISKRSLALDLETDKIASELAARRGQSQTSSVCLGILFEKDAPLQKIQTAYKKNAGCDFENLREEPAPSKSPINISSIKLDNSQTNKLSVLFSPPQGKMIFRNGENAPAAESQAEIIFQNNETARKLLLNANTGKITKQ